MESLAPSPLAVVKVGSTSVSVLVAGRLSHPLFLHAEIRSLIREPEPASALGAAMADIAARVARFQPRSGIVALGEVGRIHPELGAGLARQGFPVWTLSGVEEAQASWWGEQAFHPAAITVVDVGGGSTEVAGAGTSQSLPFGAERPPGPGSPFPPARHLHGRAVAMGGTARALASLFGNPFHRETLLRHQDRNPESWPGIAAVDERRVRLLAGGLRTFLWVMDALQLPEMAVTERDLRWGLWLSAQLGRAGRWPGA